MFFSFSDSVMLMGKCIESASVICMHSKKIFDQESQIVGHNKLLQLSDVGELGIFK